MTCKKPQNLIFIFADQMRRDMGCAGNSQVMTPNLDRMASEGFQFENAVACYPVCTPNRACILTGQYPTTLDVMENDVPLPLEQKGFGYALKNAGYRTGYIGKWHLFGPESTREDHVPKAHRHGFDDLWAVLNCRHQYMNSYYYLDDSKERTLIVGYEPDYQTDLALDFISKYQEESFALFLSWGPPHDPYEQVPEQWKQQYDIATLRWRDNVREEVIFEDFTGGRLPWYRKKPDKGLLRDYYAHISALDHNVGRIVNEIDTLGLGEDTIIVFTSDHGEMMFSQGAMQKGHPWEESIGVPFLIRHAGQIPAGSGSGVPFNSVDIMPTLLSLMSISVPDYVEGHNLSHVTMGQPGFIPEAAYIMTAFPWILPEWRGVRTRRYTYAKSLGGPLVFYDNLEDPYQLNNLVTDRNSIEVRDMLDKMTDRIGESIGDPFESWEVISKRMDDRRKEWLSKFGTLSKS